MSEAVGAVCVTLNPNLLAQKRAKVLRQVCVCVCERGGTPVRPAICLCLKNVTVTLG